MKNLSSVSACASFSSALMLLVIATGCGRQETLTKPKAVGAVAKFDSKVIDLGDLPLKSSADIHDVAVELTNVGDKPLTFSRMTMSCGCMKAVPNKASIQPGTRGKIDVAIKITAPGQKVVTLTAHSNSVGRPKTIRIKWNALAPISVDPGEVEFGGVSPNTQHTRSVRLIPDSFGVCPASKIGLSPNFHSDHLKAELTEDGILSIRLAAGTAVGRHTEYVPLELTDCWKETLSIPVRWELQPAVTATPSHIFLGSVEPGEAGKRPLILTSRRDNGLAVAPVDNESFQIEWPKQNDRVWQGKLAFIAPDETGAFTRVIKLDVSRPEKTVVEVTVSGYVTGGASE